MADHNQKVVVQTFTSPTFKEVDDKNDTSRMKFLMEYDAYVQKCETAAGAGEVHVATLISCIEGTLVKALLATNAFPDATQEEDVSEEMIRDYLLPVQKKPSLITRQSLEEILEGETWHFGVTFKEAVHRLSMAFYKKLSEKGWDKALKALEEEGLVKWVLEIFREKIGHTRFRQELETFHSLNKEARKDWQETTVKVREMAVLFDETTENVKGSAATSC